MIDLIVVAGLLWLIDGKEHVVEDINGSLNDELVDDDDEGDDKHDDDEDDEGEDDEETVFTEDSDVDDLTFSSTPSFSNADWANFEKLNFLRFVADSKLSNSLDVNWL